MIVKNGIMRCKKLLLTAMAAHTVINSAAAIVCKTVKYYIHKS